MSEATERIGDLLEQLAESLSRDGKTDTAAHLRSFRQRLIDRVELGAVLDEISRLAPLAQYADLSNQQERLLGNIQELALRLRAAE
jgi:hypothetical protein